MYGLTTNEANARKHRKDFNQEQRNVSFLDKLIEAVKDESLRILYFLVVAESVNFLISKYALGMGNDEIYSLIMLILIGMVIIISSAWQTYRQEKGVSDVLSEKIRMTHVYRDGEIREIPFEDIVVGDCVRLLPNSTIPADGILIAGGVRVNQAPLNGDNEEVTKNKTTPDEKILMLYEENFDLSNDFKCFQESVVISGEGVMEVTAVGKDTYAGRNEIGEKRQSVSPADEKTKNLIKIISRLGYLAAAIVIAKSIFSGVRSVDKYELDFLVYIILNSVMLGVSILLMAVPEGLLVIGTMVQGINVKTMRENNIYVKNPKAIETAGFMNRLFTSKTGILTNGNLFVHTIVTGDGKRFRDFKRISPTLQAMITEGAALNNEAEILGNEVFGASKIDRALLKYLVIENHMEFDKNDIEFRGSYELLAKYSYVRKKNGTIYAKGDADLIIDACNSYINENGQVRTFSQNIRDELLKKLQAERNKGRKVIAIQKKFEDDNTFIALISMKDDINRDTQNNIAKLKKAGVSITLVTGDNIDTARAVATLSRLTKSGDIYLNHDEFTQMSDKEIISILPKLRIVARANSADKSRLIELSQKAGEVVGLVGNNVSDVPIMNKADISFSIVSSTEYAKGKADAIILDDNLSTIADTVMYGRSMSKTVKKFTIFQLTVALSGVLTAVLGAFLGTSEVFTVLQMLWINMVMDILAAIAFGQEPAQEKYMLEKPTHRNEGIINNYVKSAVILCGSFITAVSVLILTNAFGIQQFIIGSTNENVVKTFMFATFMFLIVMNSLNARTNSLNLFTHITKNRKFLIVMSFVTIVQICIVQFGGEVFGTVPLTVKQWGAVILISFMILPIDLIRKFVLKKLEKHKQGV